MTRTEKFIQDNKRTLTCGRDYFNPDTSFMPVEKFEKSKLKVLVCFPSPSSVKAVSTTKEALNDYVIEHCPDVFIDFCFIPDASDIKLFDKHAIPYAVGLITHLDASHFDVIGMSISVLSEVITMASVINSFQRCDKPIPLTWTERKDMRIGEVPIIFAGGITAACGDIMYGELGDGRQAFSDFTYLGECGKLGVVFNRLIEARETGKVTRSKEDRFTYGYADDPDEDKYESLIEDVVTNQDYIDTLFDLRCIYQPQAYEVKFNDKTQIISNIKINPKAQDWVKPYYPHKMNDDLGIGRAIINASGTNTGTTQTQVSEGAHMKGNRIRTLKGLVRVEELCSKEVGDSECSGTVDTIDGPGKLYHRFTQGVKPVLIFTLKSGIRIGLTAEHPVEQWHIGDESSEFVRADSLTVGDFFMTKKSHVFGSYPMTPDEAEFLGRMVGDGSYNLYKDPREGHDVPVHRMYLSCAWSEKEYCEDLLNRAGINYKLDENQGRHCRFWIKEVDKKGRSMREFWGFNEFYKEREGKPSVKYIPAPAYKLTEEAMKSFLKGYHDADGCTSTKQGLSKVTFDCCHESIIDDIQQFLLMVGIPSRKHFNEKSRVADEEYGFYDTVNEHWSLVIASEYFDKFNELGVLKRAFGRSTRSKEHLPMPANIRELLYKTSLSSTERSHAFAQVRRNSFTKHLADKCGFKYPDVVFDEIVKIEVSESETYDLSVDKLEKLTANGCSVHNCSAGGACSFAQVASTRILTNKGIITLKDAFEQGVDLVQAISPEKIEGISHCGERDVYRVTLKSGHYNEGDENHRYMVFQDGALIETKAKDLVPGQVVFRRLGTDFVYDYQKDSHGNVFTEDKAKLLGFMHGDGHFRILEGSKQQWFIYTKSGEEEYQELFKSLLKSNDPWVAHEAGENTVLGQSKTFIISKFFDADLATVTCNNNYIPDVVFNSPESVKKSYIRGLFDADGWSNNKGIGVTTISEKFAQDIALLLQSIGFDAHIVYNGYFERNNVGRHNPSWMVTIPISYMSKFRREIGFAHKNCSHRKVANWCGTSVPRTNELVDCMRKAWAKRDYCRAEGLSNCYQYVSAHNKNIGVNLLRKFKDLHPDIQLPNFYEQVAKGILVPDEIKSVEFTGEKAEMYDVVNTETHLCSYGAVITHQCSEGNYTSGWVEKPKEQILSEIREAKKYSAGYKYKPFSFNCNYLTDYKGMLYEFIQRYPKVTFINMRMEELGRDVDAIKMMKLIGSNRISAPMEGISPRIQNVLLNKCLSEESLNAFMDDMVHAKMGDIKVGGIFTAFEEDEDFQWICDFVDKFKKRAKQEGGNFPFRLKMCATDDVLTPVPGRGLLRQSSLAEGPVVGYEEADIIATKEQGMSEVYEIVTNFGVSIKVTPNHPVLTEYHGRGVKESYYTKAIGLKPGQSVYGRIGTEVYGTNASVLGHRLTEHLAAVLGWYMGDGYANVHDNYKTHGHCFADTEIDIMDHIAKWYIDNGYNPRTHDMGSKKMKAFRIHNVVLTRALVREFGHSAYGKKISDKILQASKNIQSVFLAYWFAADGTVTTDNRGNYNSRIRLYSVNREVLKDAQAMLFNMGIIAILSGHKTKCGEKNFYTYQLEIKSCSVPKFVEIIKIPGRKGKLVQVRNTRGSHCLKANGIIKMTVKSVKRVPDEETYGIEVTNHSYLTNGILSHNTPLVHYNLTPCEYLPRLSAKKSMMGEHWLTDEWYEKFREHNVFFKVNGFRYSTFLEQSIIDLGRKATHIVYEQILKKGVEVYSLRSIAKPEIIQAFKDEINPDYFFNVRDPEHYISLSHRIHIDLMGSYIPRARRLVRNYINGNVFEGHEDVRCLKTFDGAKTMCYSKCAVKDPLKIYNDVTMDEEGNLHGEYRLLVGCERCQSTELKLARLKRPTPFTKNSDDILAAPRMKKVQRLRFVINRNKEYDVLNPNNTAHTFIAKFLQKSEKLTDWYHSMNIHSMAWQAEPELPYVCEGIQIVDTIWTSAGAYDEVSRLISEVNSDMKSVQILSCREVLMNDKLDCDDYNVFRFETKLPYDLFATSLPSYKGEIKIQGDFEAVIKKDKNCRPPVFIQVGKVVGYFALPMKYNPVFYMQQFLNAKKIPGSKIMQEIDFKCVMAVSENSRVICKNCNSEIATISLSSGKNFPFGINCLLKALLSKEMKS